jgi:hypothetical protein
MVSLWETLDPYKNGSMEFTSLQSDLLRFKVLLGVPEAPNPPKWAEFPLVYSMTCKKQQVKEIKRPQKTLRKCLWNIKY